MPLGIKILFIFICLILFSNFATNYISLRLSQREIINLNNKIMVEQLKELYNNSVNQYQIYSYSKNKDDVKNAMEKAAKAGFGNKNSVAFGVKANSVLSFVACNNTEVVWSRFIDADALKVLVERLENGITDGSITFDGYMGEYFGVYKYQEDWDYFLIRAELRKDMDKNVNRVFIITSIIILVLTLFFIAMGYIILNKEFMPLHNFTESLLEMQRNKELGIIDLSKAPNDDITYFAASFNSLSSSVNSLLNTFQKFVSKDIVAKAYSGEGVGLEGNQRELTMLFSDIKSFTFRTETLGNDIMDVLNVHYNKVIQNVHDNKGVVGSIIGDAILAVFGTTETTESKSYKSIEAAWDITRSTAELRRLMNERKNEIEKTRTLTASEMRVFEAVLLDVGVGIDGGNVFYGTIGRDDSKNPKDAHMANTVIGDTVNSASRLEGLTRIYHIPVIVSEYIKNEVERETNRYKFFEIDTVQVKGKTEGKKIFFPIDSTVADPLVVMKYGIFEQGLQSYYDGDWKSARKLFKECELEVVQVFLERMGQKSAPENWSGIWTMTTK
ncbi:MAG: adenylate/guanylate cyclase domain-containing protein [Treponema sp.]|nr:adenylate/guanylate cyclase domain-containing protein [Treponema sp.]